MSDLNLAGEKIMPNADVKQTLKTSDVHIDMPEKDIEQALEDQRKSISEFIDENLAQRKALKEQPVIEKSPVEAPPGETEWRIQAGVTVGHLNMTMSEVAANKAYKQAFIDPYEKDLASLPGMWILNPPRLGAFVKVTRQPVDIWANLGGDSIIACVPDGTEVEVVVGDFNPAGAARQRLREAAAMADYPGDEMILPKKKSSQDKPPLNRAKLRARRKAQKKARKGK